VVASGYPELKRGLDLVAGAVLLAVSLPVQVIVAVAVALDLGRPVLFRQVRTGLHGEPFTLLKFRSMRAGSGNDGQRLTGVGRFLRRTSLDELPSLVNVVRGELSLVGPRPLLPEYLPLYDAEQRRRHEVRPGITGLAQVSGRNLLSWADQFRLDVRYVDTMSARLDAWILLRTIGKVFAQEGIAAAGQHTRAKFTGTER
jgi:lipopolysaccharide/colanic/teichoic acid biosynthesis glycosyltransferase